MPVAAPTPAPGFTYNPLSTTYNTDLDVLNASGMSTSLLPAAASSTPAYTVDGTLSSLIGADNSTSAPTSFTSAVYSLPAGLNTPSAIAQMTPSEFSYLTGFSTTAAQSPAAAAAANNPDQALTANDAFNPANPFGDPVDWQIGDSELYQLDPGRLNVLNGQAVSSYNAAADEGETTAVGSTIDTSV